MGVMIYIGRTNCELCPIAAVLAYCGEGDQAQVPPLFRFAGGRPLTRPQFVTEVKQALTMAGQGGNFHLKVGEGGGGKSSGNAGNPMLGVAVIP